jgi:hypothetical protein
MSSLLLNACDLVAEIRRNRGRWPTLAEVCQAVQCNMELATKAIARVRSQWDR